MIVFSDFGGSSCISQSQIWELFTDFWIVYCRQITYARFIGYIFYILHGISINDLPVIFMGSCASIENLIVIIMYFIYKTDVVEEDGVD